MKKCLHTFWTILPSLSEIGFCQENSKSGFSSDPSLPILTYVLKALPHLMTQGQGLNPQRGLNI
jgi:hypothetical protein